LSQDVQNTLALADSGLQSVVINDTTLTKDNNRITLDGSNLKITDYEKPSTSGALVATDTVNQALGKLEKGLEDAVSGGITEVQVNGTALEKAANKVNLKVATGTKAGTLKVNDVDIAVKDAVTYTDISTPENPDRKAIILDNHDGIFGKTTTGGSALIGMVSKYDVVDLGTESLHTNLNTQKIVTVNNTQAVVTDQLLNQIVYGDGNIEVTQESATDPGTQFSYKKYKFTTKPNLTADSITLANSLSLGGRSVSGISAAITGATNNGVLATEAYVDDGLSNKYNYSSIVKGTTEGAPTANTAVYSAAKTGELLELKQDNITNTSTIAKDGTGLKVVDGSIGATQLDSLTKNNLLNAATAGNGLEITDGTADAAANISLKLKGTTLEATTDGLHVAESGITSNELASDSVTTAKIVDKNVTKGKLSQDVQDSLDLADSGLQSVIINNTTLTKDSNRITLDGSNL
jgi:hypothetical protein